MAYSSRQIHLAAKYLENRYFPFDADHRDSHQQAAGGANAGSEPRILSNSADGCAARGTHRAAAQAARHGRFAAAVIVKAIAAATIAASIFSSETSPRQAQSHGDWPRAHARRQLRPDHS
jgi:hypothetical protein